MSLVLKDPLVGCTLGFCWSPYPLCWPVEMFEGEIGRGKRTGLLSWPGWGCVIASYLAFSLLGSGQALSESHGFGMWVVNTRAALVQFFFGFRMWPMCKTR
jgi:hypothetical protein